MTPLDLLTILAAMVVCIGYLCRADGLNIREHRPSYLLLHLGLFMTAVHAGAHAYEHGAGLRDWCGLLGSGAWLVVSFYSWRTGVPDHVRRRPRIAIQEPRHESSCRTGHR